ncbi:MAG: amino-acid N-acetyltransferase [Chitinispirillaceae bacterium]|nr:amino-acid N-acetyltransferase [Chitinispirillaceae bacterium]
MNKSSLKEHVEIIRQAFGYIDQFKGETFVIKISSELIASPFIPILIKDLVLLHRMGIRIILVPGARSRIDEVLATYGMECKRVNGVRVSPPESIPFIKMAAFDVSNKIMTVLAECGANAVIGNWVKARSIGVRNGVDFQNSGIVERLQSDIVENVLADGLIPIFPNIGWNAKGKPYNLSSNELAYAISISLKAAKLFFLSNGGRIRAQDYDVPEGTSIADDGTITQLTVTNAGLFLERNNRKKRDPCLEMINLAFQACSSGVRRVHIIDGAAEGMILKEIFSNRGLGTMVYANQHENIRQMTSADIPEVLGLMQPAIEDAILMPRTAADLEEKVDDYYAYEVDGTIHGCGALHLFDDRQGEIAAIVVDETYENLGIGGKIISYLVDRAIALRLKAVFVLTTQTSDWFAQLGFTEATVADLPPQRRKHYNQKRNSLILRRCLARRQGKIAASVE